MSDVEDYDPFQVFEVEHRPCMLFHVKVLRGRTITKGSWMADLLDTPDPYVLLKMKSAPEGRKRTRTIDNNTNPEWNESFTFLLDSKDTNNVLEISLMEANYLYDETLGVVSFNINQLVMNVTQLQTFKFNQTSQVDMEMKIQFDTDPTLRYSLCLNPEEKCFRRKRRQRIMKTLQNMLGDEGPQDLSEVPNIGILGSGGGFRAMVGFSGVFKALRDTGLLDTAMYVGALSGSSWYVSQLYSHPDWPHISPGEQMEELKNNIDSSLMWLMKPQSVYRYLDRILQKRHQGQPVSFTDFFGHLVGETLLKQRLHVRLTDQQAVLKEGLVPMPLYTCVHVKKDISAKVFQEWIEFTPYEIGIPKYGTFMPASLFGSKFFLGKLCKLYDEQPLHYLQGIWGSAFCILFKRLLDNNRKLDPVEMIRQEMEKELDETHHDDSSDSSDSEHHDREVPVTADSDSSDSENEAHGSQQTHSKSVVSEKIILKRKRTVTFSSDVVEHQLEEDDDLESVQTYKRPYSGRGHGRTPRKKPRLTKMMSSQRTKQKGFWTTFLEGMFTNSNLTLLSTRAGRAGVIHNPLRGLSVQRSYPFSPFTPMPPVTSQDEFDGIFDLHPTTEKHLYMVDAGLTFNSPFPLLLRPQRATDLILSFDFSARPSDESPPFKELLLAEKWAHLNGVPFPPIDTSVYKREGMKELYVFQHPTNPHCPVILHFVLVNKDFRHFKKPGVPRTMQEDKDFANFDLFNDPHTPYSTFNFKYPHEAFDRLSQLTEFNTLNHIAEIQEAIAACVVKKRTHGQRLPVRSNKVNFVPGIKNLTKRRQLKRFLQRMESSVPNSQKEPMDERPIIKPGRPVLKLPRQNVHQSDSEDSEYESMPDSAESLFFSCPSSFSQLPS